LLAASPYVFDADRLVEISDLSCKRFVEAEPNTTYIYTYNLYVALLVLLSLDQRNLIVLDE
jgi:hypothetical protein